MNDNQKDMISIPVGGIALIAFGAAGLKLAVSDNPKKTINWYWINDWYWHYYFSNYC